MEAWEEDSEEEEILLVDEEASPSRRARRLYWISQRSSPSYTRQRETRINFVQIARKLNVLICLTRLESSCRNRTLFGQGEDWC